MESWRSFATLVLLLVTAVACQTPEPLTTEVRTETVHTTRPATPDGPTSGPTPNPTPNPTPGPTPGPTPFIATTAPSSAATNSTITGLSTADISGIVVGAIMLIIIIILHVLCCQCNPRRCLYAKTYLLHPSSYFETSKDDEEKSSTERRLSELGTRSSIRPDPDDDHEAVIGERFGGHREGNNHCRPQLPSDRRDTETVGPTTGQQNTTVHLESEKGTSVVTTVHADSDQEK